MEIHNTTEDLVVTEVNTICDSLETEEGRNAICTCKQCRLDTICYVLNRADPHYVVSHRGLARIDLAADQQTRVDLTTLVYEGLRRVSHNKRPYFSHDTDGNRKISPDSPVFNIPTIVGRVFNGLNFSPITGITVELRQNGSLVDMRDNNWHNPYTLIADTNGNFTFWPKPVAAETMNTQGLFEYTVRIAAPNFAERIHVFSVSLISEPANSAISLSKTFKLPDIFLFPPGEEQHRLIIDE